MKPLRKIQLMKGTETVGIHCCRDRERAIMVAQARLEGKRVSVWLSDLIYAACEPARQEIEGRRESEA